jgi:hypothetical protein
MVDERGAFLAWRMIRTRRRARLIWARISVNPAAAISAALFSLGAGQAADAANQTSKLTRAAAELWDTCSLAPA